MAEKIDVTVEQVVAARREISEARDVHEALVRLFDPEIDANTETRWSQRAGCAALAAQLQRSYTLAQDHTLQSRQLADQGSTRVKNFVEDLDAEQFAAEQAMFRIVEIVNQLKPDQ